MGLFEPKLMKLHYYYWTVMFYYISINSNVVIKYIWSLFGLTK